MFMFVTTLVFIFIIRLRFPSKVSIATKLVERAGGATSSHFGIQFTEGSYELGTEKWRFGNAWLLFSVEGVRKN